METFFAKTTTKTGEYSLLFLRIAYMKILQFARLLSVERRRNIIFISLCADNKLLFKRINDITCMTIWEHIFLFGLYTNDTFICLYSQPLQMLYKKEFIKNDIIFQSERKKLFPITTDKKVNFSSVIMISLLPSYHWWLLTNNRFENFSHSILFHLFFNYIHNDHFTSFYTCVYEDAKRNSNHGILISMLLYSLSSWNESFLPSVNINFILNFFCCSNILWIISETNKLKIKLFVRRSTLKEEKHKYHNIIWVYKYYIQDIWNN